MININWNLTSGEIESIEQARKMTRINCCSWTFCFDKLSDSQTWDYFFGRFTQRFKFDCVDMITKKLNQYNTTHNNLRKHT